METIAGHMCCCGFTVAAADVLKAQDDDAAELQQAGIVRCSMHPTL